MSSSTRIEISICSMTSCGSALIHYSPSATYCLRMGGMNVFNLHDIEGEMGELFCHPKKLEKCARRRYPFDCDIDIRYL